MPPLHNLTANEAVIPVDPDIFESQKSIDGAFDVADSDVGSDVLMGLVIDRGLETWELAAGLRRAHGIADAGPVWYAGLL